MEDPVQDGVAQVDIRRRHVDPRAQHPCAVRELARAHAREQVQVFVDRPVARGALPTGQGQRAAVFADLIAGQIVDVGVAGPNEVCSPLVQLLEVVRCVIQTIGPVEAEPAHVRLYRVDVLLLLLNRIGVIEPKVAVAIELARDAEVQAYRLRVADVQVPVGLWRKACDDV